MRRQRISSKADLVRIEQRPYSEFMTHASVGDALADAATRFGDRRALTFIGSHDMDEVAQTWTHARFYQMVRRAARMFREIAGDAQPRVAMLLPAIPQAYFALWGAEVCGVACPINYLLNVDHIHELVVASGANILVALGPTDELDIWSKAEALLARSRQLKAALVVGSVPHADPRVADFDNLLAHVSDDPDPVPSREANEIVALFHTGGTTGAPKLAQHTHRNQLHAAWGAAQMYGTTERDVVMNGFPLFHVAGSFVFGLSTLLSGGEVVLPTLLGLRNISFVKQYWDFVQRHGVTLLAAVPTVLGTLLNLDRAGLDWSGTRFLLTGGSPLPTELASAFERKHGIPVRNILGMTECAGVISIEPGLALRTPGSCGLPLPFTEVVAVRDDGSPCMPNESGILRVRGPNVGPGYTDAARNAGVFVAGGWLVTGDIGHVDEHGLVYVTGRAKDVIIRSGHNVDPGMIEEALLRYPGVLAAAAVGEPDEYAGEVPVAFISTTPGARVDLDELSEFVKQHIPERPAFPRRIDVVESMPQTAVGKIYKPTLRATAATRSLQDRLSRVPLARSATVVVQEDSKGLKAIFTRKLDAIADADPQEVKAFMTPYAIPYFIIPERS